MHCWYEAGGLSSTPHPPFLTCVLLGDPQNRTSKATPASGSRKGGWGHTSVLPNLNWRLYFGVLVLYEKNNNKSRGQRASGFVSICTDPHLDLQQLCIPPNPLNRAFLLPLGKRMNYPYLFSQRLPLHPFLALLLIKVVALAKQNAALHYMAKSTT